MTEPTTSVHAEAAIGMLARQACSAIGAVGVLVVRDGPGAEPVVIHADGVDPATFPRLRPTIPTIVGAEIASHGSRFRVLAALAPGAQPLATVEAETFRNLATVLAALAAERDRAASAEARWSLAARALDQISVGVVLLNGEEAATVNSAAADILRRRVPGATEVAPRHLARLLAETRAGGGEPATTGAGRGAADLVIFAAPIGTDGDPAAAGLVFLCDPEAPFLRHVDLMRRQFGLTRMEAQLVAHLVDGDDLAEIARKLHLSIHTVRAYLKRIFVLTGVNRQSTLVRLVLRGVGQMAPDGQIQPVLRVQPAPRRRKDPPPANPDTAAHPTVGLPGNRTPDGLSATA